MYCMYVCMYDVAEFMGITKMFCIVSRLCTFVCVCMYACIYVHMYECMCVCIVGSSRRFAQSRSLHRSTAIHIHQHAD
jgi:hypothetical protein